MPKSAGQPGMCISCVMGTIPMDLDLHDFEREDLPCPEECLFLTNLSGFGEQGKLL